MTITITLVGFFTFIGWLAMVIALGFICVGWDILISIGEPEWWMFVIAAILHTGALWIAIASALHLWG